MSTPGRRRKEREKREACKKRGICPQCQRNEKGSMFLSCDECRERNRIRMNEKNAEIRGRWKYQIEERYEEYLEE